MDFSPGKACCLFSVFVSKIHSLNVLIHFFKDKWKAERDSDVSCFFGSCRVCQQGGPKFVQGLAAFVTRSSWWDVKYAWKKDGSRQYHLIHNNSRIFLSSCSETLN